jgi:anti-anti-sigma factor
MGVPQPTRHDELADQPAAPRAPSRAEQIAGLGGLSMGSWRDGSVHTITLCGELDLAHARRVEQELTGVESGDAGAIVVDLSGLTFIDSSGIRLLLLAHRRSRSKGKRLRLRRPPERIYDVLRACAVDGILPIDD